MLTVFLTHQPDDIAAYYERALPELHPIADVRVNPLERDLTTPELIAAAAGCDVIIAHRSTAGEAALFTELPGLVAILRCAIDITTIDVEAAIAAGVLVARADKSFVASTAELALALMPSPGVGQPARSDRHTPSRRAHPGQRRRAGAQLGRTDPCNPGRHLPTPHRQRRAHPSPAGLVGLAFHFRGDTMTPSYATYPSLADRGVFITGGAAGIGSALVEQFARQGCRVAFVDISIGQAQSTIERCVKAGATNTPLFFEVDLLDIPALQRACAEAVEALGGVAVLVNNAANDDRHDWRDVTPEYFDNRINTNLRHYFFAIQALAPQMIEAGRGSIVNIGSSSYLMQEDMFPGYAIAKSAVEGITRTMARTFGPHGVRVNTVMPGWVPTERQLTKWWTPESEQATLDDQAIKRRITPDEFAQMVLFLAADDGAACTAQHFLVDGGRF